MAAITTFKQVKNRPSHEWERIQTFGGGQPYDVTSDDGEVTGEFNSVTIIGDGVEFTTLTAVDAGGNEFDYLAHCNMTGKRFNASEGYLPLTAPDKFVAIEISAGRVRLDR